MVDVIEGKPWYKSKGIVGALMVAFGTLVLKVGEFVQGDADANSVMEALVLLGGALSLIGIRLGNAPVKKSLK